MGTKKGSNLIEEYFASHSKEVQLLLNQVRNVIREEAPEADETISYGIPTFKLAGNLVHYAAFKNHIGFYPAPVGLEQFKDQLSGYVQGKGSVQFPFDKPVPFDLIREIVRFRVAQNMAKAEKKLKKRK